MGDWTSRQIYKLVGWQGERRHFWIRQVAHVVGGMCVALPFIGWSPDYVRVGVGGVLLTVIMVKETKENPFQPLKKSIVDTIAWVVGYVGVAWI